MTPKNDIEKSPLTDLDLGLAHSLERNGDPGPVNPDTRPAGPGWRWDALLGMWLNDPGSDTSLFKEPPDSHTPLAERVGELSDATGTVDPGPAVSGRPEGMPHEDPSARSWLPSLPPYTHVITGTDGDDRIRGNHNGSNFVDAGDGDDTVYTYDYDDRIDAGAGNDDVAAGGGNDIIWGGEGGDELYGDAGNDTLYGGAGNDRLYGDALYSEAGHDRLYGGIGDDQLVGGTGDDYLLGEAGDDRLKGGAGDDLLVGGTGDDYLGGGAGKDVLNGGEGDDFLHGGAGMNVLEGGAGDDVFAMSRTEIMIITDFKIGEDKISLYGSRVTKIKHEGNGTQLDIDNGGSIYLDNIYTSDIRLHWETMFQ